MKRTRTYWPSSNGNGSKPSLPSRPSSTSANETDNPLLSSPEYDTQPRSNGKHPGGRPPKYHPSHPHRAYHLISRDGLMDYELAIAFGVTTAAISQWKEEHPEFLKSYEKAWHDFAYGPASAKSLACRARGYSHPEEKVFLGPGGEIVTHNTTKHYPPDTAAAIFLACNWSRRVGNKDFMQTHKVEHSGEIKTGDAETKELLRKLLDKIDPANLTVLEETLERIACSNQQPC